MQGAIADAAPERHYDVPPRPAPVETDFGSNNEPAWSAPEPSYPDDARAEGRDARGRATQGAVAEPAAPEGGSEPLPVSSDERQAS
jgi:hypothetical protein